VADDDDKLGAMAMDICARATLHRMKADAVELANFYQFLDPGQQRWLRANYSTLMTVPVSCQIGNSVVVAVV
jgi:hypothetical protein